ncbi:MAG: hypothetical protein ACJARD_000294 [Alphaproteobacteria bacterium]|jgi:hypothetical protein
MFQKLKNYLTDLSVIFTILTFLGVTSISAISTYLSDQTKVLNNYGDFKYAIIFAIFFIIYSLCFYFFAKSKKFLSETKLNEKFLEKTHSINLLEDKFENKIINVIDLWSHTHFSIENKIFTNCRFMGPMSIAFSDSNLSIGKLSNVTLVDISKKFKDTLIYGGLLFDKCHFINCEFSTLTIFGPEHLFLQIEGITQNDII